MKKIVLTLMIGSFLLGFSYGQNKILIPKILSNIEYDANGNLQFISPETGAKAPLVTLKNLFSADNILINPVGTEEGVEFDFNNKDLNGNLYYGMYSARKSKYPQPVFFKKVAKIKEGKASVNLKMMAGKYDIADYEKRGIMTLGYRIETAWGQIIYDGKVNVKGKGPFEVALSIVEGPFVNKVTDHSAVISFNTNFPCNAHVEVNGKNYSGKSLLGNMRGDIHHEVLIDGLKPDKEYEYTVVYGDQKETYSFKTNHAKGSRKPFVFAFTSDSRAGNGGGERNIYGTNAYVMKKMAALAASKGAAFFQFTGDMINGYSDSNSEEKLEYINWKHSVEPFWHYMPFYTAPGNHEVALRIFDDGSKFGISVDKFPYNTMSGERTFANEFVNFENGPGSEDGSKYDPDKSNMDFPPYKETAYYYIYGNVAIIVMNSNYLYTPNTQKIPEIGGNVHGYIMDNQLKWFEKTLKRLDNDPDIDHIFVTIHTPAFPNGGHKGDDMWYNGNNNIRPYIDGKPVKKGIIERRDEFLNLMVNKSKKVVAVLTGDEHNYCRMKLTPNTDIYPEKWGKKRLKLHRSIWHITNGSCGAPYYGQQQLPWSDAVQKFSTQYALMLFKIDGKKIALEVVNPDTLEEVENVILKK